ncbi:MAG: voltage-gated chloride channel [Spirochaetae bacterium HGW-Spirochaetae-6]|nr:MAG: voltage-gated chloride channel [Spirochaetae bacterium HGW-Spirochaetae-6]
MRDKVAEQSLIFFSIFKWALLATAIGIIVGFGSTTFLKILAWSLEKATRFPYLFLGLPFVFLSVMLINKYLAPDAAGHGTEKVIEAVHRHSGKIKVSVVPVKLLTTVLTLTAGGSAGKEGPCAQIGAGLSSLFADIFRFKPEDRKMLVICGISAGFSSVFGTPIAGAIFGAEVLFSGRLSYRNLLPAFIAGIVGFQVSSALGIQYTYHPLGGQYAFSPSFFLLVLLAAIVFGLVSFLLVEFLKYFELIGKKLNKLLFLKAMLGGGALIALTFLFSKDYLGLGLPQIDSALSGKPVLLYAFFLKILFTSITLSFGGSGGIVTPIFFIGAAAGASFAQVLHLDNGTFAAIGMVSLLAGAAQTPNAASILSVELFGTTIAPYASIACVISFLMTGHRSVFPSQVLASSKSDTVVIDTEKGNAMEHIKVYFNSDNERVIRKSKVFASRFKKLKK